MFRRTSGEISCMFDSHWQCLLLACMLARSACWLPSQGTAQSCSWLGILQLTVSAAHPSKHPRSQCHLSSCLLFHQTSCQKQCCIMVYVSAPVKAGGDDTAATPPPKRTAVPRSMHEASKPVLSYRVLAAQPAQCSVCAARCGSG